MSPARSTLALLMLAACSSGPIPLGRLDLTDGGLGPNGEGGQGEVCDPPAPSRHYSFDGVGTEIADLSGGAPARALGGAELDGSGTLRLDGEDDYVDLPNGILAGLTEVTIAVWVKRDGGPGYTRIFDIGTSSLGQDPPAGASTVGQSYLAVTPATGLTPHGLAVLASQDGAGGEVAAASDVVLDKEMRFIAVVVSKDALSLYYEGELVARAAQPISLAAIVDDNAWLGRSQYAADPYLTAEYADLRVFGAALADCAVRALFAQGPDPR